MINQVPPVAAQPKPEGAVFAFTWLSYTGSGMLIAAIIAGFIMGFSPVRLVKAYGETIKVCFYSLITISAMLAIGTLTRLSGVDATLGLAFAGAGVLYPFFGCSAGSVSRSPAPTRRRTSCSETCKRSRRSSWGCRRF